MSEKTHAADPAAAAEATQPPIHELEAQRRANRDAVRDLGIDPYGHAEPGLMSLTEAAAAYDEAADQAHQASEAARKQFKKESPGAPESDWPAIADDRPRVTVAGRVVLHRDNGKLVWINLRSPDRESFQVAVSKRDCDELGFKTAKSTDLGDVIVAEGPLMKTRTGEVTCWASSVRPASKCLVPPPEKRAGLADIEQRYRQRYLDLWATPESARVFTLRGTLIAEMRNWLTGRGYTEVETPILQPMAGGAAARPFVTHMNALDIDLYLRIAPELYLKRLLVGGMRKIYEINKNFRNEGVSPRHNPEFTVIELYEAFGDYHSMMELTESMVRRLAEVAAAERVGEDGVSQDPLVIRFGAAGDDGDEDAPPPIDVDYGSPFDRITYAELFERALGFPPSDTDKALAAATERGLKTTGKDGAALDPLLVVNELFEEVAEPTIDPTRPTWVTDYPASLSPLTRPSATNPAIAERADLFIAGMEIGPHYTELNNPDVQEAKFKEQLTGLDADESTFRTFDEDFIRALKVGMPPAGGMGLGIDRLCMLLANRRSIRDVILFPLLRPEGGKPTAAAPGDDEE